MTKPELHHSPSFADSLVIRTSGFFRHSTFVIRHCPKWLTICLCLCLCATGFSTLRAAEPFAQNEYRERLAYTASIAALFKQGKFDELEHTAKELRATKARIPSGLWKLSFFYNGIASRDYPANEADWNEALRRLDEWKKEYPDSITQAVARSRVLNHSGNRRGGRSSTAEARTVLEEARKLPEKCPQWFREMAEVAFDQGWSGAEYEKFLKEAIAFEPQYYDLYFIAVFYFLPQWHGEQGDLEKFLEDLVKSNPGGEGKTIYARTVWSLSYVYTNVFKESKIKWPLMKEGFEELMKNYPSSNWNLNAYAKYAVDAGDRATASELIKKIRNFDIEAWGSPGLVEAALTWIDKPDSLTQAQAVLSSRNGKAGSIAFSPDGKLLATGYRNGRIAVWDPKSRSSTRDFNMEDEVNSVAFSADGKLMAAGSGDLYYGSRGEVRIWETKDWKEFGQFAAQKGPVAKVRFTPDSKSLITAGGPRNKLSEVMVYDLAAKTVTHIPKLEEHGHHLEALAISPDSEVIVVDCTHPTFVPFRMATSMFLLDSYPKFRTYVQSVAFSPDGKLLAVAGSPSWNKLAEPGQLKLYDVPAWDQKLWPEHKPVIKLISSGVLSVSFSPDGKLLATGGHDRCVRVWDISTGDAVATLTGPDKAVTEVAFSPDGQSIAGSDEDGAVRIWKTPEAKEMTKPQ